MPFSLWAPKAHDKPPPTWSLLHPAQGLPPWVWYANSPTPITTDGLLGSHGSLTLFASVCFPQGCPLIPHASPLLQQDSSASSGSDTTCRDTSLHRDTLRTLLRLWRLHSLLQVGNLLAPVRLRPGQLSYADALLIQLRLQYPPLGHCSCPHPHTRYGWSTFLCPIWL